MKVSRHIINVVFTISLLILLSAGASVDAAMILEKESFGTTKDGTEVDLYTLTNENGIVVQITNYEGIVKSILVPDEAGNIADVVLGYETLEEYIEFDPYFGGIQDKGTQRLNNLVWDVREFKNEDGVGIELSTQTNMGDDVESSLFVNVTYTLNHENDLKIEYGATTESETTVNLTNDIYFNLGGEQADSILDHEMLINGEGYYPQNLQTMRPINQLQSVAGTPMNYTRQRALRPGVQNQENEQIRAMSGYQHIWRIDEMAEKPGILPLAARVLDPESKRVLEVRTTASGMWFETGNFLDQTMNGKQDTPYGIHSGFTLAAREVNLSGATPNFPAVPILPHQAYSHTTIYKFFAM